MKTLIKGGTIVNEGKQTVASIIVEDDRIKDIITEGITVSDADSFDSIIDAEGCIVMPGVIDAHVHFREPGLTHKADMESESRAAACGGVTSVFEMPNTNPQTTTLAAFADKEKIAAEKMHINYAFFPGATNDNIDELRQLDVHQIPGIKLFMGSSTGNMLVDQAESLDAVFSLAKEMDLPVMAHCEDTETINRNMASIKAEQGTDDPAITSHPAIRSHEACLKSSELGVQFARKHGTHLHIAHLTTRQEIPLLSDNISGEATVAHLLFTDVDYLTLGGRIKCNPAVKSIEDRNALRQALADGTIMTVGTDHAPHAIEEKQGGAAKAMSGMPMIQFSLVAMLSLVDEGILSLPRLVEVMSHNTARLFKVSKRGFLRPGYKADIVIVKRNEVPWTVTKDSIESKCGWSPVEGRQFQWSVEHTLCNGHHIYNKGTFDMNARGEHLEFRIQN